MNKKIANRDCQNIKNSLGLVNIEKVFLVRKTTSAMAE